DGLLPSNFAVAGFGMKPDGPIEGEKDQYIRDRARDGIEQNSRQPLEEGNWEDFARALFFVEGSFSDAEAYKRLKDRLDEIDAQFGIPGSGLFYLSIPP